MAFSTICDKILCAMSLVRVALSEISTTWKWDVESGFSPPTLVNKMDTNSFKAIAAACGAPPGKYTPFRLRFPPGYFSKLFDRR